jgi:2-oxoglutarate ferredoxin oxidoreductase subunit beta
MIKEKTCGKPNLFTPLVWSYCPGCGYGIITRIVCEVIEELGIEDRVIGCCGVGCGFVFFSVINMDGIFCPHGRSPSIATGIKHANFGKPILLTQQGDGDAAAIGAGSLVNAAVRAEKITVMMCNNAVYGTTGGQLAPTTLVGQSTTTTPDGRDAAFCGYPVHIPEMLATLKGVVYAARGAVNSPANYTHTRKYLKAALQKQIDGIGFSIVEILSPCPPNWRMTPVECLKWMEEKMIPEFPLGEFKNVDSID